MKIHILDCTLRDGGYCNNWEFGNKNTKKVVGGLTDAGIDIVELGFLTNRVEYNSETTNFTSVENLAEAIPLKRQNSQYVAMMNYGDYSIDDIPDYDGKSVDGFRVAFHKKDRYKALEICKQIKEKGYIVHVNAMVTVCYTDEEFLELIDCVNKIDPNAFYIVDTFGMMKEKELMRLFYVVEKRLNENIWIGFHSHNNIQLAFSNSLKLISVPSNRNLVIDSSVYGMGRGAGNLNTELFVEYLNDNLGGKYDLNPLVVIIDEVLNYFYQKEPWGYSMPNYLSAINNAHPNYAGYFSAKNTLTLEAMSDIFKSMEGDNKFEFDKKYAEEVYLAYMNSGSANDANIEKIRELIKGKTVILIGPGKSSESEKNKIIAKYSDGHALAISVNFDYKYLDTDYIFVSNMRRFRELEADKQSKCIATSNIKASNAFAQVEYRDLLLDNPVIEDNSGMMAIKWLIQIGAKKVVLCGFDGYSHYYGDNYADSKMNIVTKNELIDKINSSIKLALVDFQNSIDLEILGDSKYK
ncbi:MAG: 3-hydroxy-3-methylglutaryl-CoA lyase [Bacillota bacterium]